MLREDQGFRPQRINPLRDCAFGPSPRLLGLLTPAVVRLLMMVFSASLAGLLITLASTGSARQQLGRSGLGTGAQGTTEPRQQQQPQPITPPDNGVSPSLTPRQKQDLLRSNFEKMKKDTDVLLDLAKSLQKDLDGSNQNVLSLKVLDKADKIEKLAKKIKNSARGY
jgi:hypothetical protein